MKNFAINLAKKAGNALASYFCNSYKLFGIRGSVKEVTTKYDKIVDKLIIKEITKKYPNHGILTEESGLLKGNSDWLWIVDSLDGTVNFACGNPLFSVCLALMRGPELILGIVFAPAINEFYFVQKGKGAFLNGKRIKVSKTRNLQGSYLYLCEGGEKNRIRTKKILNKIYPKVTDLRKLGSAGIEAAWVAAGKGDGYVTTKIEPWDVAAGVLLVQEAGGKVTDFKGKPWTLERNDLIFSNNRIHRDLQKLVKN